YFAWGAIWVKDTTATADAFIKDSSGNGNHGSPINGTTFTQGKIGKARSFDGSDDYVDCGSGASLDITGAITIEAWIYPIGKGDSDYPRIVDKSSGVGGGDPGYKIYLRAAQGYTLTLSGGGSSYTSTLAANLNNWNYLVFIITETKWKLFLNGNWEEWDDIAKPSSVVQHLYIGNSPVDNRHFNGVIDEVRISNVARSADYIR
ncbi:unnamed protein product, partial [marine sediment metagenome]